MYISVSLKPQEHMGISSIVGIETNIRCGERKENKKNKKERAREANGHDADLRRGKEEPTSKIRKHLEMWCVRESYHARSM